MRRSCLLSALLAASSASLGAEQLPAELPRGRPPDARPETEAPAEEQRADLYGRSGRGAPSRDVSLGPDGLEIASADGTVSLSLGGRLHVDWTRHSGDTGPAKAIDGRDVRRARIEIGGRLGESWRLAAETDFAGDDVSIKDLWLAHDVRDGLRLTVGHQKQPYNLALEMSSNDIPFVERGIDNALLEPFVDRAIGIRTDVERVRWFAAAGIFGESLDDEGGGWGTAGRFVLAPVATEDHVLHIGLRAAYREPDATASIVRLRDRTTSFSALSIVDTGDIDGVENVLLFGPEAVFAAGAFSVVGEYNVARVASARGDAELDSWHIAATWSPTGESRAAAYDLGAGEFKRLEPTASVSRANGSGAWELAWRYAAIDLDDDFVAGGKEKTLTVAASWYLNRNIRLMLDWTRVVETDGNSALRAAAEGLDVVTLRGQWAF